MKIETSLHLTTLLKLDVPFISHRPRIICSDGFSVSIQASCFHYCSPRNNYGPYTRFELGFPTEIIDLWIPFVESFSENQDPREQVYPYVPIDLIVEELKRRDDVSLMNNNFQYVPESMRNFKW